MSINLLLQAASLIDDSESEKSIVTVSHPNKQHREELLGQTQLSSSSNFNSKENQNSSDQIRSSSSNNFLTNSSIPGSNVRESDSLGNPVGGSLSRPTSQILTATTVPSISSAEVYRVLISQARALEEQSLQQQPTQFSSVQQYDYGFPFPLNCVSSLPALLTSSHLVPSNFAIVSNQNYLSGLPVSSTSSATTTSTTSLGRVPGPNSLPVQSLSASSSIQDFNSYLSSTSTSPLPLPLPLPLSYPQQYQPQSVSRQPFENTTTISATSTAQALPTKKEGNKRNLSNSNNSSEFVEEQLRNTGAVRPSIIQTGRESNYSLEGHNRPPLPYQQQKRPRKSKKMINNEAVSNHDWKALGASNPIIAKVIDTNNLNAGVAVGVGPTTSTMTSQPTSYQATSPPIVDYTDLLHPLSDPMVAVFNDEAKSAQGVTDKRSLGTTNGQLPRHQPDNLLPLPQNEQEVSLTTIIDIKQIKSHNNNSNHNSLKSSSKANTKLISKRFIDDSLGRQEEEILQKVKDKVTSFLKAKAKPTSTIPTATTNLCDSDFGYQSSSSLSGGEDHLSPEVKAVRQLPFLQFKAFMAKRKKTQSNMLPATDNQANESKEDDEKNDTVPRTSSTIVVTESPGRMLKKRKISSNTKNDPKEAEISAIDTNETTGTSEQTSDEAILFDTNGSYHQQSSVKRPTIPISEDGSNRYYSGPNGNSSYRYVPVNVQQDTNGKHIHDVANFLVSRGNSHNTTTLPTNDQIGGSSSIAVKKESVPVTSAVVVPPTTTTTTAVAPVNSTPKLDRSAFLEVAPNYLPMPPKIEIIQDAKAAIKRLKPETKQKILSQLNITIPRIFPKMPITTSNDPTTNTTTTTSSNNDSYIDHDKHINDNFQKYSDVLIVKDDNIIRHERNEAEGLLIAGFMTEYLHRYPSKLHVNSNSEINEYNFYYMDHELYQRAKDKLTTRFPILIDIWRMFIIAINCMKISPERRKGSLLVAVNLLVCPETALTPSSSPTLMTAFSLDVFEMVSGIRKQLRSNRKKKNEINDIHIPTVTSMPSTNYPPMVPPTTTMANTDRSQSLSILKHHPDSRIRHQDLYSSVPTGLNTLSASYRTSNPIPYISVVNPAGTEFIGSDGQRYRIVPAVNSSSLYSPISSSPKGNG